MNVNHRMENAPPTNRGARRAVTETSTYSTYDIKKLVGTCSEIYCFNKCKILPCHNLCKHLFSCSCQDYRNGNICKHVHKIHAFINLNTGAVDSSNSDVDFTSKQHSNFTDTDNSVPSIRFWAKDEAD